MNVKETVAQVINSICQKKNFFDHKHILFVGQNTTGKSRAIANIVKELSLKSEPVYYICSWNRKIINERNEIVKTFKDIDPCRVVASRLDRSNFNKDIFCDELGTELVMNELYVNSEKYTELFEDFLDIRVNSSKIELGEHAHGFFDKDILVINEEEFEFLSDSQVSMMRILMEVNFAVENGCKYIFIDEFDINLDYLNSSSFLEWLKNRYEGIVFIVSAHSLYTILNLKDFDVVKIIKSYKSVDDDLCLFFDSNDLDNIDLIDKKLFGNTYIESETDQLLSSYLKNVLSKISINMEHVEALEKSDTLTTRQKVILDYIKQRMGEI